MPTTVRVRGDGGSEWDEDLAPVGSMRREIFDDMVAKGVLTIVDGDLDEDPSEAGGGDPGERPALTGEPPAQGVPFPEHDTIDEVVKWVRQDTDAGEPSDGWPERAAAALDREVAKGKDARPTLVTLLESAATPTTEA